VKRERTPYRTAGTARLGEDAVAEHLERMGFTIMHRNLRLGRGEIDIVASQGDLVVLVEVKSRLSTRRGRPEEAVTGAKRRQLRRLGILLAARDPHKRYRFDVASVTWKGDGNPEVRYFENAFTLTETG
jgi:putative endonuclease